MARIQKEREIAQRRKRDLEVELRVGPFDDCDIWTKLVDAIGAPCTTSATFSITRRDPSNPHQVLILRRDIIESRGSPSIEYMTKNTLARWDAATSGGCAIRIACADECAHSAWFPNDDDDMRLRVRKSVKLRDTWTIDLTLVAQTTVGKWKENRATWAAQFTNESLSAAERCRGIVRDSKCQIELECEIVAPGAKFAPPVSIADINEAIARISAIIDPIVQCVVPGSTISRSSALGFAIHFVTRNCATRNLATRSDRAKHDLKSILNNARSISRSEYLREYYPFADYYVTEKADGERAIALVDARGSILIAYDAMDPRELVNMRDFDIANVQYVFDGELIVTRDARYLYAFDCLFARGESIVARDFAYRIAQVSVIDSGNTHIRAKHFEHLARGCNLREIISRVANAPHEEYEIDGLIFTQGGCGYYDTRNIKWKPYEKTTIDFLCLEVAREFIGHDPFLIPSDQVRVADSAKGHSDFHIFVLYCTCSAEQRRAYCVRDISRVLRESVGSARSAEVISRMQFECRFVSNAYILVLRDEDIARFGKVDGRVFEMRWRIERESEPWRKWDILRVREDKHVGNNIAVATSVFANYIDPFPLEVLWESGTQYFERETSQDQFFASDKYRRFVITELFWRAARTYFGSDRSAMRILDLGGGRAQDFTRFALMGATHVLNLDADAGAIAESVARIEKVERAQVTATLAARWLRALGVTAEDMDTQIRANRARGCNWATYDARVVNVSELDVAELREIVTETFANPCVDMINFSFSFHYLCQSEDMVARIFNAMDAVLSAQGIIVITTMDGARVFERLRTQQTTGTKYRIELCNAQKDEKMRAFGQMIRVSVPFSDEMYEEPLCNFGAVDRVARNAGFVRAETRNHGDNIELFSRADPQISRDLSAEDREYSALFTSIIYRRRANRKK